MLPGLTRTAAQPASIAAKTYLGWKWMSAITGICDLRAMAGSASASSWLGQATRTMSQPDRRQLGDLLQRRVDVRGGRRAHRLDADRGVAADLDLADLDLAASAAEGRATGGGSGGHTEGDGHGPVSPAGRARARAVRDAGSAAEVDRLDDVGVDEQHATAPSSTIDTA